MDSIQLSLRYIAIKTKQLEKMLTFYTEKVGLKILNFENEVVFLGNDEDKTPLLMLVDEKWEENNAHHLNHFAFRFLTEKALSSLYHHLKAQNIEMGPLVKKGQITHFFIKDPDNNEIELYHCHPGSLKETLDTKEMEIEPEETTASHLHHKHLGHVHLSVNALEDTLSFYRDILHLDLVAHHDAYHLVDSNEEQLMLSIDENKVNPSSSIDFIAFQVPTMEELLLLKQRLEAFDYDFYFNRGKKIIQLWDANRISYWIQAV